MTTARQNTSRRNRRAVAATEFAVCLPVIVLLMLGMIEACSMIFLKQSLSVAAYEGAHTAVKPGATSAEVRTTCETILGDRRVRSANIEVAPADVEAIPVGEFMTVRISAPSRDNAVLPLRFFRGSNIESAAVVMKEF